MDPLMLLFLLIAGRTGADSVSSVGLVSIQRGGSVTIPCFYDNIYQQHVKYWCRGSYLSCTPIVRTDYPKKTGKVSIRDDPDQRVFNVTMNNLTDGDSGYYSCGVEISRGSAVGTWVYLSVTEGSPGLSVDKQEVTGVEGDSVSVQCHSKYYYGKMSWCRMGGSCVSRSSGLDGRPVLIRHDRVNKVFSVTMRGLERKDTGWYWCDDRYQQIPVHITVSLRNTTTTSTERADSVSSVGRVSVQRGGSVTIPCFYDKIYQQHVKYWCRDYYSSDSCTPIVRSDSPQTKDDVSIRDVPDQRVFTVSMNNLQTGESDYYWCGVEISRGSAVGTWMQLSVTAGVSTLNRVSVQRGGTVTIACYYDNMYQQHVKYWCRGSDWSSCTPIVHTNYPKISEVSIRDDPNQPVFALTINNVKPADSGYYWCGVEISRGSAVGTWMQLSVTAGVSTLNTVTVQRGGSVTIPCFYDNMYQQQVKYWCKGSDWSSCTPKVRSDSPQTKDEVSIRDDPDQRVFTVTMNNLKPGDFGSYWCGVEISRGAAVGTRVSLSVTEGVSTLNTVSVQRGGSVTIPCSYDERYKTHVKYWCNGSDWSSCTPIVRSDSTQISGEVSIIDDPDQRVFNVTMNNLTATGSYWCGVDITGGAAVGTRVYLSVTEEGGNNEKQRWEQVLDAVLKAGTGVFYLICTIIAIQLHWSTYRKRGSNQREN